jgi:hypothetical protein
MERRLWLTAWAGSVASLMTKSDRVAAWGFERRSSPATPATFFKGPSHVRRHLHAEGFAGVRDVIVVPHVVQHERDRDGLGVR